MLRLGYMVASVALVVCLAVWDQWRSSQETLEELAKQQGQLATAVAETLRQRLAASPGMSARELLSGTALIEAPGQQMVLLAGPPHAGFLSPTGANISSRHLSALLAGEASSAFLNADEAAQIGLPLAPAVAGLARVNREEARWGIAVVASLDDTRSRQRRGRWRIALGVGVAALSIAALGASALRQQRRELELARALQLEEVDRRLFEERRRVDRMATAAALSTGIAHELATPLGVILGKVELLLMRHAQDERTANALLSIQQEVEGIRRVMTGFLALARGEVPTMEPTALMPVLTQATERLQGAFARAGVAVDVQVRGSIPRVLADAQLLQHVFLNLLLNACEASSAGSRVEVDVRVLEGRVRVAVRDEGEGISEAVARRATEPFFTTKGSGGTGLGLAVSNEIVRHHQGTLTLHPRKEPERGTEAVVELPVAEVKLGAA